jgi:geranylgeranyl reductase family protein
VRIRERGDQTELWDVAVVGAGPAGAAASRAAASAGKSVVLLERSSIPRYKTCGGGLVGASLRALPAGMQPPIRAQVKEFSFSMNGRFEYTKRSKMPIVSLVCRDEFDAALVRLACEAGAVVHEQVTITQLVERDDFIQLKTAEGKHINARVVVGADGSAGRTGRYVGVELVEVDLGLEVEIPLSPTQAAAWAGRLLVDWGRLRGAYAWVFPKGDSLSVGVIAARGRGAETRTYLNDFLVRLGLDHLNPTVNSGHLTRCRTDRSPLFRGRTLVAGDAAGLCEPWTREGISFALRSGALAGSAAAQAVDASSAEEITGLLNGYAREVDSTLGAEMRGGRLFMAAFIRRPWFFHLAIITMPVAWRVFIRLVRGETTFANVDRHCLARFVVARLAR